MTIQLKHLIETLECFEEQTPVEWGEMLSWRGAYSNLTMDRRDSMYENVGDLLDDLHHLMSGKKSLEGYKGGQYTFNASTLVYADNHSDSNGCELLGVVVKNGVLRPVWYMPEQIQW